jgi:hypothetical protein
MKMLLLNFFESKAIANVLNDMLLLLFLLLLLPLLLLSLLLLLQAWLDDVVAHCENKITVDFPIIAGKGETLAFQKRQRKWESHSICP